MVKPCPYCGNQPKLKQDPWTDTRERFERREPDWIAYCRGTKPDTEHALFGVGSTQSAALEQWNREVSAAAERPV